MVRAQTGDQEAYAELLGRLTTAARRYVRAARGETAWGDDVVQETLLAVHRARHTYDPARAFAPWFYAIAKNRLIDAIRRERRLGAREVAGEAPPERATEPRLPTPPLADDLKTALQALPARQRTVIVGLKIEDESVREVSARLGMSESAVKVTAHRGYAALRRLLGTRNR